ncbi:MAG: hypothetical protein WBO82_05470 [Neisseria sp.]|jgi:hypothetical protein
MAKKMLSCSAEFKAEGIKKIAADNGNRREAARQLTIAIKLTYLAKVSNRIDK